MNTHSCPILDGLDVTVRAVLPTFYSGYFNSSHPRILLLLRQLLDRHLGFSIPAQVCQ
jgi:hypothetical protein